jgi:uncharacterized protein YjbJ (UPF0337 family)
MVSTGAQAEWTQTKSKIATKWSKLPEADLECLKGSMENLSGKLQKIYGYSKEKADQEYADFKKTMSPGKKEHLS